MTIVGILSRVKYGGTVSTKKTGRLAPPDQPGAEDKGTSHHRRHVRQEGDQSPRRIQPFDSRDRNWRCQEHQGTDCDADRPAIARAVNVPKYGGDYKNKRENEDRSTPGRDPKRRVRYWITIVRFMVYSADCRRLIGGVARSTINLPLCDAQAYPIPDKRRSHFPSLYRGASPPAVSPANRGGRLTGAVCRW